MITHLKDRWDNLLNNETYFAKHAQWWNKHKIKIREDVCTLFIKKSKQAKEMEKTWEGNVYGFGIKIGSSLRLELIGNRCFR